MRVFAGPRDDAFYFDSGATFDTLNLRTSRSSAHPVQRMPGRARLIPPRWTASRAITSA